MDLYYLLVGDLPRHALFRNVWYALVWVAYLPDHFVNDCDSFYLRRGCVNELLFQLHGYYDAQQLALRV